MKRISLLILAAVLSLTAGVQTAMAQKVTLYSAGSKAYECDIAQLDSIVFSEAQTIPAEEIVVTVDANGNADGGHQFTRIDEATFLIDGLKYKYESGSLLVSGYDPVFFAGTAKIISKLIYNGRSMNVVGIGSNAFKYCSSLTSVTIGSGVTSIGGSAFASCTSLTSITIPESVTSIGERAFDGCTSLTSITIGSGVTSIDIYAFYGCSSLTSVTIPESVTYISERAFYYCSSLTSIIVEGDNTVYDSRNNCNAIIKTATNTLIAGCKNTAIPNSVTSIGDSAFSGCSSLTSITIPESVTSIGESAFYYCTSLTSITIPNSVTSIGNYAFSGCSGLTDVYCYAEKVPSTSSHAFYNSPISSATLHVPARSVGAYWAAYPWKNFGSIVAIE